MNCYCVYRSHEEGLILTEILQWKRSLLALSFKLVTFQPRSPSICCHTFCARFGHFHGSMIGPQPTKKRLVAFKYSLFHWIGLTELRTSNWPLGAAGPTPGDHWAIFSRRWVSVFKVDGKKNWHVGVKWQSSLHFYSNLRWSFSSSHFLLGS